MKIVIIHKITIKKKHSFYKILFFYFNFFFSEIKNKKKKKKNKKKKKMEEEINFPQPNKPNFHDKVILAPMVRASTLPLRL